MRGGRRGSWALEGDAAGCAGRGARARKSWVTRTPGSAGAGFGEQWAGHAARAPLHGHQGHKTCARVPATLSAECSPPHPPRAGVLPPHLAGGHQGPESCASSCVSARSGIREGDPEPHGKPPAGPRAVIRGGGGHGKGSPGHRGPLSGGHKGRTSGP